MLEQTLHHTRETARRIFEIYVEGRDWFYFLSLLAVIVLRYGLPAAGQLAIPFFVLHTMSQLTLFGFHGHIRHSLQLSDEAPATIWKRAIKARLSLLIITFPILFLANHTTFFILYAAIWIFSRFLNEIVLAGARFNHRLNDWMLIRTIILSGTILYLWSTDSIYNTETAFRVISYSEAAMLATLLISRVSKFPLPLIPRIDFTQLQQALPHFYAQMLFTYNYYYLMVPISLLLPLLATAEVYIQLLILSLGLVPAYIVWNDYRTGRPRMNESELTAATLALGIRGTVISFCIVTVGLFLTETCIGDIAGMAVVLPQFIILLSHYYTIPTLHALTEEGRIHALIRLWFVFILLQGIVAFFILQSEHPNLLFPVMAVVALAQSMSFFLLRNLRYE